MSTPLNPSQYQYQYIQQLDSPTRITMGSQTTQTGFSEYSLDGSPTSNGNLDNLVPGRMESPNGNLGSGVAYGHGDLISGGVGGHNANLESAGAHGGNLGLPPFLYIVD
ncbi:hypothetical protein Pst134EA_030574 [Puccinia striiformis f. sp. tritici]|uniref:hypothetical protein n=1 Tax=Puccinia striiformis f. sp. tritici TaxID=168172 RepID=UPI00200809A5|nr:hypothetical protein Pst134EA_030574 [Puccinia striiformis f. sp. tritici]KAH9446665.1 hypothetical protein Pst134EA_030574 [Puccinia striiformis f. sp. tritici]